MRWGFYSVGRVDVESPWNEEEEEEEERRYGGVSKIMQVICALMCNLLPSSSAVFC